MHSLRHLALFAFGYFLTFGLPAVAQDPSILDSGVAITTANETTTLNRDTRRLQSSLLVTVANTGSSRIEAPLHVAVGFTELNGASLDGLNVPGTLGGPGQAPYNASYFDCSAKAGGDGLAPGESFELTIAFDRPREIVVSYDLQLAGFVNQPPVAVTDAPYRGTVDEDVTLDASLSSDPEGGGLTFAWTLPNGSTLNGPTVQASFAQAGLQQVALAVTDDRGATTSDQVEVVVLPPGEFALARTRVLDGLGHPLDAIDVSEEGPNGSTQFTLQNGGFGSLGSAPGDYLWRFSREGHLTVCRRATLLAGEVSVVPNPWMPKLSTGGTTLSVINDSTIATADGSLQFLFPGGAFTQVAEAFLTELHGQSLPGALPAGWSPLAAFHLTLPQAPLQVGTLTATLPEGLPAGPQLLLARFDEANCEWIARELLTPDNGTVTAAMTSFGSFAILLADADPTAPPAATVNAALPAFPTAPQIAGVTASGEVDPAEAVASRVSSAITAQATVAFTGPAALPSGTWFQADAREHYELSSGQSIIVPAFDQTYYAYRGLGADSSIVTAEFPIRPTLLFGPEELNVARVQVDVLGRVTFAGGVVAPGGGVLAAGPVTLTLPGGAIMNPAAAGLRILSPDDFAAFADGIVSAFALDIGDLAPGTELAFAFNAPVTPNANFLLAKLSTAGSRSGLQPVTRLASDANGNLTSIEPVSEPRLNGIRGPGSYLLLQAPEPLALIQGRTLDPGNAPFPGAAVSVVSAPWLCISNGGGNYELVATQGPGSLLAQDLATGDAGTASFTVDPALAPLAIDLTIGPAGPSVIATSPPGGATGASRVTPITVTFSEALHPGTFDSTAVVLRFTNNGAAVPAALTLAPGNTVATLLATNPLDYDTDFIIDVGPHLTDPTGLPLEGNRFFGFKTEPAPVRAAGAQLVIYEPGAQNIPQEVLDDLVGYDPVANPSAVVVSGSPGTADPEVPVILVNDITGAAATILSKPDGSFASFLDADVDDYVKAVFVNSNGTRIEIPATRQLFDDGRVGLYKYGGILEAESDGGPVEVLVEPEAVEGRATFKVEGINIGELLALIGEDNMPENGKIVGGTTIEVSGDFAMDAVSELSMPLDPATLELNPGVDPEGAAFALAIVRDIGGGDKAFQVVDKMRYEDGRVETNTLPFLGFIAAVAAEAAFESALSFTLIAVLIGNDPVVVTAKTLESDLTGLAAILLGGAKPVSGAFVTAQPANVRSGRPGRLRSGSIYATSDEKGEFTLILPIDAGSAALPFGAPPGFVLTASHPRYTQRPSVPFNFGDFGIGFGQTIAGNIAGEDLIFQPEPVGLFGAPRLNVAHSPLYPAPGQEVTVQINASHGTLAAPMVTASIAADGVISFPGVTPDNGAVTITETSVVNPTFNSTRWTGSLTSSEDVAAVILDIMVSSGASGNSTTQSLQYAIEFSGEAPPLVTTLPVSDPNDALGPLVTGTIPTERSFLSPGDTITVFFNEPVDKSVESMASAFILERTSGTSASGSNTGVVSGIQLSPDQQSMTVSLAGLVEDSGYTFTLPSTAVRDLTGNPLDQKPGTLGEDSHSFPFQTPATVQAELPALESGGGNALLGNYLYALDRGDAAAAIKIYNVSNPTAPSLEGQLSLTATPRDLVVIPEYSYKLEPQGDPVTSPILAVVAGDFEPIADDDGNVYQSGQIMRVYSLADPLNPTILGTAQISLRVSMARQIRWDPPFLVYHEFGADIQNIAYVNLQEFLLGFQASDVDLLLFPEEGQEGTDVNGDGDFVDDGEMLPIPPGNPFLISEFFGKKRSYVVDNPWRPVSDFDSKGGTLGIVYRSRGDIPGGYFTAQFSGVELDQDNATIFFPGAYVKRVALFDDLLVKVGDEIKNPFLALVSLAPDSDGKYKLAVIDITLPETPQLLRTIVFPDGFLPRPIQSIRKRADGLLELATSYDSVLIDPLLMAAPNPASGPHPSVVGIQPAGGTSTVSLGISNGGYRAISLTGANRVVMNAPAFQFVAFSDPALGGSVFDPEQLPGQDEEAIRNLLDRAEEKRELQPGRFQERMGEASTLSPPSPLVHYHVLVNAPGGAGETIDVAVESLNRAAYPHKSRGRNFPPVRAMSEDGVAAIGQEPRPNCDAPIVPLKAWRLSDDPASPLFNTYLSSPFALTYERMTLEQVEALTTEFPRAILWAGAYIRASLDFSMLGNSVLREFAAEAVIDEKIMRSGCGITAPSLPGFYNMGTNPPPTGGTVSAPGTFGTVSTHNGEVRTDTVDMELPSRRMPISFRRTLGGQDLYDGPFGRGWDFNYNQQLIELNSAGLTGATTIPLIDKQNDDDDVIARRKDVLFSSGDARIIHFKHMGESPPPEISSDPLVQELGWDADGIGFYLPEKGIFDILIKFQDGKFARLTSDGTQFWYRPDGRLETIYHRYATNFQILEYNARDELVKIIDKSVDSERFLELGYYRLDGDPITISGLDESTDNPFIAGKVARLKDYAERDIFFEYDTEGVLNKRLGVDLAGTNGGYAGRQTTNYLWDAECDFRGIVTGGGDAAVGTPLYATTLEKDADTAQAQARDGGGAGGTVSVSAAPTDSAQTTGETVNVVGPDGELTRLQFDENGYAMEVKMTGANGEDATFATPHNEYGLVRETTYPEGNKVTYEYDIANPSWRSRGNLLSITTDPGPRGGDPGQLVATWSYDDRYNLPSGQHQDYNGNSIQYTLSNDGKDVATIAYPGVGTEEHEFNEFGQQESLVDATGTSQSWSFDGSNGFLTSHRAGTVETGFSYNGTVAGKLGKPTSITPPSGGAISTGYDARLMPVSANRGGRTSTMAYDENGNMIIESVAVSGAQSRVTEYEYDQVNFLKRKTIKGVEVNGAGTDIEMTYTPDDAKRVKTITYNPGNRLRTYTYDHRGFVIGMNLGQYEETYEVDTHGNTTSISAGGDLVQERRYDGYDRLVEQTHKTGGDDEITTLGYFGNSELKSRVVTGPTGIVVDMAITAVDSVGRPEGMIHTGSTINPSISYSYSSLNGNGTTTTATGPRDTATVMVDGAGRKLADTNSLRSLAYGNYDGFNLQELQSSEDASTFTYTTSYDGLDNLTSTSDDLGETQAFTPRFDGRPTTVTDARGKTTSQSFTVLGEILNRSKPNGITFNYQYSQHRKPSFRGGTAGRNLNYDDTYRLDKTTFRDGSEAAVGAFDGRNNPQSVALPGGGTIANTYDLRSRPLTTDIAFAGTSYQVETSYDALSRPKLVMFGTSKQNSCDYSYDPAGPVTFVACNEGGFPYTLAYTHYDDRTIAACTYPSGMVVENDRELNGRLTNVSTPTGDICTITKFYGTGQPEEIAHGDGLILQTNAWDQRRRMLACEFRRASDNAVLAGLSFRYDPTNNVTGRQFRHRNGRADFFAYDDGNRLTAAHVGARPAFLEEPTDIAGFTLSEAGFAPGYVARTYDFGPEDIILGVPTSDYDSNVELPFAQVFGAYNDFLTAESLDGFARGSDALGNTIRTLLYVRDGGGVTAPTPIGATLLYNGRSNLVEVTRDDGVVISYDYRHDGLMHRRRVVDDGTLVSDRAYVWDMGKLIEEYEFVDDAAGVLEGRYYYADTDYPTAADLRQDDGTLQRHYFLCDNLYSTVAVADDSANVVERCIYDAYGQVVIEQQDTAPPVIERIVGHPDGFVLEFSEAVFAEFTGDSSPGEIAAGNADPSEAFTLSSGSSLTITTAFDPARPGFPHGSAVLIAADNTNLAPLALTLAADQFVDEWSNPAAAETINFTGNTTAGTVLFNRGAGSTAPVQVPVSAAGNPFLYHGQFFDEFAGLSYMRARWYDPHTAQFLQRDSVAYGDSTNLYAGFAHNGTSYRDPSGQSIINWARRATYWLSRVRKSSKILRPLRSFGRKLNQPIRKFAKRRQGLSAHRQGAKEIASPDGSRIRRLPEPNARASTPSTSGVTVKKFSHGPDDEMVTLYRFSDRTRPGTLMPPMVRNPDITPAKATDVWHKVSTDPGMRSAVAHHHMNPSQLPEIYKESPFVSLASNHAKAATTRDPWLQKIARGTGTYKNAERAPDIGVFRVPKSKLQYPRSDNTLSTGETEVLFRGFDLHRYLEKWIKNPY